ncbi:metal-dependent phosphohydrolase [Desulfoluna limicola]|uniref:Metal-dependent phosphohydrolase n=1 Tax=Desulfoluna limicola TaxID=2810562 RepID=A0ABN6F5J1_9BACT|nr:HD domain-containing protein [Desulfoluna limicola]BCS96786.1 metal-dependent phosphohydrolase [Desulfoluna limicola]
MEELKQWFAGYTARFISGEEEGDRNIILKQQHTRRVCRESLFLAHRLGLDPMQTAIAETAALFHDIGRFEQYRRFNTFVDTQSMDHARLGHETIEEEQCLAQLPPEDQDLIKRVVLYHNRAFLPENETDECLFYSRLLRDADKLDIWYVVTSYYAELGKKRNKTLELDLPDTPGISEKVYASLMKRQVVLKKDLQNLNDFKLLQMGWVFDLNFTPSIGRLADKGYLRLIKHTLPGEARIDRVYETITQYMEEKTQNN